MIIDSIQPDRVLLAKKKKEVLVWFKHVRHSYRGTFVITPSVDVQKIP